MAKVIVPEDWPCKLVDLRPGAFVPEDTPNMLCFKSEYHTNEGKIEAYNLAGEFWCGDPNMLLIPVRIEEREV